MMRLFPRCAKLSLLLAVLVAGMLLDASSVFGQATSSGTVVGTATDSQGAVVPGATITLTDTTLKTSRTVPSNDAGQYVFVNVPPGSYTLSATLAEHLRTRIDQHHCWAPC